MVDTFPKLEFKKAKQTVELNKRFYAPGYKVTDKCTECGNIVTTDLTNNYLSSPVVGVPAEVYYCCSKCDHEWEVKVVVTFSVALWSAP